jgi:hypothetical protein
MWMKQPNGFEFSLRGPVVRSRPSLASVRLRHLFHGPHSDEKESMAQIWREKLVPKKFPVSH